jgi:hypothetical protein
MSAALIILLGIIVFAVGIIVGLIARAVAFCLLVIWTWLTS